MHLKAERNRDSSFWKVGHSDRGVGRCNNVELKHKELSASYVCSKYGISYKNLQAENLNDIQRGLITGARTDGTSIS